MVTCRLTEPAEPARTPTIRRAVPEELKALHDFAARFERPGLPPLIETLASPQAVVLIAISAGRIVGLWRAEGERRITVTHLLVDPAVEESGLYKALLVHGMWLCWAAGAVEIGGYLPLDSPLLPLAESLGAERGAVCLWVGGPLREETLFADELLELCQGELVAEVEGELRRRRHRGSEPFEESPR